MSSPSRIGVLAALRYPKYRDVLRGLVADPDRAARWQLRCEEPTSPQRVAELVAWGAQGLVVQAGSEDLCEALVGVGIPVVNISNVRPEPRLPQVVVDDRAVGRAAADHLRARFVSHAAMVSAPAAFARLRAEGFRRAIGLPVSLHPGGDLCRWLLGLPRPVGVFAVDERLAYAVIGACRESGLRVPEEVAVVAAGDDEVLCASCWPTISCIPLAGESIGRAAAGLLDALLAGRPAPRRPVLVAPGTVIARRSTDAVSSADPLVRDVVSSMRARLHEAVGVRQLLAGHQRSRRSIEAHFAAVLGRSPLQVLTALRLERAQQLLRGGGLPLAAVARRCGIATGGHLGTLFRRHLGCTPGAWRDGAG